MPTYKSCHSTRLSTTWSFPSSLSASVTTMVWAIKHTSTSTLQAIHVYCSYSAVSMYYVLHERGRCSRVISYPHCFSWTLPCSYCTSTALLMRNSNIAHPVLLPRTSTHYLPRQFPTVNFCGIFLIPIPNPNQAIYHTVPDPSFLLIHNLLVVQRITFPRPPSTFILY